MNILNYLFPKQCLVCCRVGEDICNKCLTEIPLVLPSCCICKKLSNGYWTHNQCSKKKFQCITGWYISKELERMLRKKSDLGIYSVHRYMLNILIERVNLRERINNYSILPLPSKQNSEVLINRELVKGLKRESEGSKNILFVGNSFDNIYNLEGLINEPFNITILTLFRHSTL